MSSGGCGGITGTFGSCQRTSQNAENIDRLANSFNSLNDYVMEIGAQTDETFFLVADELAKVYKVQNEMQENQNRNWKLVEEQFAIIDHNLNALAICMEIQLSQQQLNFNSSKIWGGLPHRNRIPPSAVSNQLQNHTA